MEDSVNCLLAHNIRDCAFRDCRFEAEGDAAALMAEPVLLTGCENISF